MAILFSAANLQEVNERIEVPNNFSHTERPTFHAYRDAGHVAAGNQIVFNGTRLNVGNCFNTSTGFFTAPVAGPYWLYFWGMDASVATYNNQYVRLQINSSGTNELRIYTSTNASARTQISGGIVARLEAGDTARVFNQNRTNIYGTSYVYCYFNGFLIG